MTCEYLCRCEFCKSEFYASYNRLRKRRFCSLECFGKARIGKTLDQISTLSSSHRWREAVSKGMLRAYQRHSPGLERELKRRRTKAYRMRHSEILTKAMNRPSVRRELLARSKDPAYKRTLGNAQKKAWKEGRRTVCGFMLRPSGRVSESEKVLAERFKEEGIPCQSQFKVPGTRYEADFYFEEVNLIVEYDGHPSHYDDRKRILHDKKRDRVLRKLGYHVLHLRKRDISGRKAKKHCVARVLGMVKKLRKVKMSYENGS